MTWARIDDAILDNPKIAAVGPMGFALHVAAVTWCARNLSDGAFPFTAARRLLSPEWADQAGQRWEIASTCGSRCLDSSETIDLVEARLVEAGLWEVTEAGYRIHDYLDYNLSRAEAEAERARKKGDQAAAGRASAEARRQKYGSALPINAPNGTRTSPPNSRRTTVPNDPRTTPPNSRRTQDQDQDQDRSISRTNVLSPRPAGADGDREVFDAWIAATGRNGTTKLTGDRRRKIAARRKDGYTQGDLVDAARGVALSPHHMGDNDRGTRYDDLELICRDGHHLEFFRDLYRAGGPAKPTNATDRQVMALMTSSYEGDEPGGNIE